MQDFSVRMAKRLLSDGIWKSVNLEGLGTTFPKTEAILANAPTNTRTEEVLFVVSMKRAWQFLFDNFNYCNSIELMQEFNKIVGTLLFSFAGEIRGISAQNSGISYRSKLLKVESILNFMKEIESIKDVELRVLQYFCFVSKSQLFVKGNKRVTQLMVNKY